MLLIVASIPPPPPSRYSRENAENPCLAASSFLRNERMGKNRAPLLANDFLAEIQRTNCSIYRATCSLYACIQGKIR